MTYETKAGIPSEALVFAKLLENLREAQECSYMLGHLRKANDDNVTGQGFIAVGEIFKRMIANVTALATSSLGGLH